MPSSRTVTDAQGRQWRCVQQGRAGSGHVTASERDAPAEGQDVFLECTSAPDKTPVFVIAGMDWMEIPDARLVQMILSELANDGR